MDLRLLIISSLLVAVPTVLVLECGIALLLEHRRRRLIREAVEEPKPDKHDTGPMEPVSTPAGGGGGGGT